MSEVIKYIKYNGFDLVSAGYDTLKEMIVSSSRGTDKSLYIHVNHYNYYKLLSHKEHLSSIRENTIFVFEGIAMKVSAFILGLGWNKDANGTDLFPLIAGKAISENIRIFLLGAESNILTKACENIFKTYPNLQICGYNDGYFKDTEMIIDKINKSRCDLLIAGMGIEKETEFIGSHISEIDIKTVWCVGGLFDFLSGERKRAPLFLRKARLEWLWRFIAEPKSKFFRIFVVTVWFVFHNFVLLIKRNHD